jgi:hypothetical protein
MLAGPSGIKAQRKPDLWWINAGLGYGIWESSTDGISLGAGFSMSKESHLFSIRYVFIEELNLFGPLPAETIWDIGLLYGKFKQSSLGIASISGGLGLLGGVKRGKYLRGSNWLFGPAHYESLKFTTIGFPLEGQIFWTPFDHFGIGINGFCNLNAKNSFAGGLFCIRFGTFK